MLKNDRSYRSEKYIKLLKKYLWSPLSWIFRIEISGIENVPSGACMLIANHNSGAILESHSLLFSLADTGQKIFGLNHPALFKIPFINTHFRKIGAVTASHEMAHEVLESGHGLLIFPGGNRQAFRPWKQRHQHSFPWARGWAEIAVQTKVPVVPIKFIGSHNANPIFACSSFLSKALILPWLLGVKWFPISLAQVLFTFVFVLFAAVLNSSWLFAAFGAYLAFCLTPLIPVLPTRIKIKIYPAMQGFVSSEHLQKQMDELMDKPDYPQGARRKYPLNGIERFMLFHESSEVRYNSHFVFEFTGRLDRERILETTDKWISFLPHTRSIVLKGWWQSQRYCYDSAWFSAKDIVVFEEGMSQQRVDSFCAQPFFLHNEPAVCFLIQSDGSRHKMIFSCHHSLFDGAGQAYAFEQWSLLYNGEEPEKKWTSLQVFRYRDLKKNMGMLSFGRHVLKNMSFRPPRSSIEVATLVDQTSLEKSRQVRAIIMHVNPKQSMRSDFYEQALRAFDRVLQQQSDHQRPILVYMPTGLRWPLKIKNSLQNIVVSHLLFLNRSTFANGTLAEKIAKKLKSDPIQANLKFLFGCLPICAFGRESILKKQFSAMDRNERSITSSLLLVNAPIPKGFTTPLDWEDLYISARGTLLRSPGIGLIFTGKPGRETITIEYIPGLISEAAIKMLLAELSEFTLNNEPMRLKEK